MLGAVANFLESIRTPPLKQIFFPALPLNRKLALWYAGKVVAPDSQVEGLDQLKQINELRKQRHSLTFICNHLTYADSHIIEVLLLRSGMKDLADHLVHIAGQKTYQLSRLFMTRSLNTIRVYQPKAKINSLLKKRMNFRATKWATHLKKRGYSLLVFPEGTRSRHQKKFNVHGANPKTTIYFRHSYVVPLALMGAEKIMPLGTIVPRRGTVRLRIGSPLDHSSVERMIHDQHSDKTEKELRQILMTYYMNKINELLEAEYRAG